MLRSHRSLLLTCNPSACHLPLETPSFRPPPQLHRAGAGRGARPDPRCPPPRARQAPPLPGRPQEARRAVRPPSGPGPRRARAHSLRCRPPPPQLGLARLGLRISARPADLSASMAAPAAAAKTPAGKLSAGPAARSAPRSSLLPPRRAPRRRRREGRGPPGHAHGHAPSAPPRPGSRDLRAALPKAV